MIETSENAVPRQAPHRSFVSFSMNGEDVILHRLFGDRANGYYVDVGAAHPTFENDTRALHDRGWSGINIEPNPELFAELAAARPRDRNLQLALSDEDGTITYWEVVGTGLSTCDTAEAERARAQGFDVRETRIRCATLSAVLDEARPPNVDVLKVDVEGFELRVLRGNDWTRYRPSVIIVEVTYPGAPERRPDDIRPFLEQNGYNFAYFDGLNDFFVERAFTVPEDAFRPSNIFDHVLPYTLVSLREHAANLEHDRGVQEKYIESLRMQLAMFEADIARLRRETAAFRAHAVRDREEVKQALEAKRLIGERVLVLARELDRAAFKETRLHQSVAAHVAKLREAETYRDIAETRRSEAERYRGDAELYRNEADKQRGEAEKYRSDADLWRSEAEKCRGDAELYRTEAEKQRSDADLWRTEAEKQRSDAELYRTEAEKHRTMLSATLESTSWRVTHPLRVLARLLGRT